MSLISYLYGDSSAPLLFRHRDPYDPLLSVNMNKSRTRTTYIAIAVPPRWYRQLFKYFKRVNSVLNIFKLELYNLVFIVKGLKTAFNTS
jgi:hypothetical protein